MGVLSVAPGYIPAARDVRVAARLLDRPRTRTEIELCLHERCGEPLDVLLKAKIVAYNGQSRLWSLTEDGRAWLAQLDERRDRRRGFESMASQNRGLVPA